MTVVEGHDLAYRYGSVTALDGASFEVGPGVTGLLGPNGAGKTTLIRLLLGLTVPDRGTLRVLGLDPSNDGAGVRQRLGFSPEHHRLPADLRAVDLVRHSAELHGLPGTEARNRASDLCWLVGLGEERARPLGTLSTGQRQRIKLAAAIVHDPELVVLDEPTEGLDPVQRDEVLSLIGRIGREYGMHVLLSSHVLEEVERTCDAAVILANGRVVASTSLRDPLGDEGVVVHLGSPDEVLQVGRRLHRMPGVELERAGSQLVVRGAPPDAVRDAIADAGASVRRLQRRHASLEDVFLAAAAEPEPEPTTA